MFVFAWPCCLPSCSLCALSNETPPDNNLCFASITSLVEPSLAPGMRDDVRLNPALLLASSSCLSSTFRVKFFLFINGLR